MNMLLFDVVSCCLLVFLLSCGLLELRESLLKLYHLGKRPKMRIGKGQRNPFRMMRKAIEIYWKS